MQTQNKPKDIKIKQTKFNRGFEERDKILAEEESENETVVFRKPYQNDNMDPFEPRKYTEDLGINLKNLFFDILEMLGNNQNPMPYIMENPKKQFLFGVMALSFGILLMFFSNLMI
jgi:hypothetical protein